jgi:tripartite-type tricarboxylate transporter receptor subunit TctC
MSVVNIAGASGAIAAAQLALAPADGSTLMIGTPSEVGLSHLLRRHFRFDPLVDTTPVALIGRQPLVWVTSARAAPTSIAAWAAFAARAGRPLRYGTSGVGTPLHLAGETLRLRTGLPLQHVPYRGAGPVLQDLHTEALDMAVLVLSSALPMIRDGRLRALGLTQATPAAAAPGIAPLATLPGLEGLDLAIWFGLLAPPRFPAALATQWRQATRSALALPALLQRLTDAGLALEPERDFAAFLRDEVTRYRKLVEAAGMMPG